MAASSAAILLASAWWLAAVPPGDDGADLAARYIARWRPSSMPPQAAAFARQVVPTAGPGGWERAKNLLW
ncbi:MAG TPA: hypothetical protein VKV80_21395, partial [Streptosporangiaceae bacterium]|nr:hypothetical protein [Streptosporangiaceae bacterium]